MTLSNYSLSNVLGLIERTGPAQVLSSEIAMLRRVITSIKEEIESRENLGREIQSGLEKQLSHLNLERGKTDDIYRRGASTIGMEFEKIMEAVHRQRVHSTEQTTRDVIELKKLLWHYYLVLVRKEQALDIMR